MFSTRMALLSLPFLKFLILYGWMLAFMYVCVPHVCLVPLEFRREHSVVGIVIWVLATERQPSPRTSDLSHWVIFPAHNYLKLSSPSPPFPLYFMISWWKEPLVLWPQSRTVVGPKPFLSLVESFLSIPFEGQDPLVGNSPASSHWGGSKQMSSGGEDTGSWMSVVSFAQGEGIVKFDHD